MQTVVAYWPAVIAGFYLAYTVVSGNTAQLPIAISGFVASLGTAHGRPSPVAKLFSPKK